jgi:hypothetical protein
MTCDIKTKEKIKKTGNAFSHYIYEEQQETPVYSSSILEFIYLFFFYYLHLASNSYV